MRTNRSISAGVLLVALAAVATPAQDGSTRTRRVATSPAAASPSAMPAQVITPVPRPAAGQQMPVDPVDEPIELSTDLVNILFSVTDLKNRFVGDIKQDEIVVKEAGETQRVFSFRRESNLPLSVAVLIDVSTSQEFTFNDQKRYAADFLHKVLRPRQDQAAVARFGGDVDVLQGMTGRLERVSDTFNRLAWEGHLDTGANAGGTSLYDAVSLASKDFFPPDPGVSDPASVVRKAIIVLTDGQDTSSERSIKGAIDDALRSGVIVYAIGVGDRYRSTAVKRDVLDLLAAQTGGRAYFPTSSVDLAGAFAQIEEELRSQYVLAYEPTQMVRDGSFREITIGVQGRTGVKVFHRKGYYSPKTAPTAVVPAGGTK